MAGAWIDPSQRPERSDGGSAKSGGAVDTASRTAASVRSGCVIWLSLASRFAIQVCY
jgi:hypothetical protein